MSTDRGEGIGSIIRLAIMAIIYVLGFVFLVMTLHDIQIHETKKFASQQEMHSVRRIRLPATRGRIMDAHGNVLADNEPSFCVSLYIEEMRKPGKWENTIDYVDKLVDKISLFIGKPREVTRDGIWTHIRRRRALPLIAFSGLDDEAVAKLSENLSLFPGVDITVQSKRVYPYGDTACHLIGYVGKGQPQKDESAEDFVENFDFLLPDLVGRDGVEKSCDYVLSGQGGCELIQINAVGYKHETIVGQAPVPGKDIELTLDLRLQRIAEHSLSGKRGAVVVMDCETGDLIVLASSPRYDLSTFVPRLSGEDWNILMNDPDKPLYGRATSGEYAPGSIFKPLVAMAALEAGVIDEHTEVFCSGSVNVGGREFKCARRLGHGSVHLRDAIAGSCNPYFIVVGTKLGYEPAIYEMCEKMGFGKRPDLGIPCGKGLLPSAAWKNRVFRDRWRAGDTANLSMGQGYINVTPLQVAVYTSALANGGNVLVPRLIKHRGGDGANVACTMDWSKRHLALVKSGMFDVINTPYGTGKRAYVEGVKMAGKTGTAEFYDKGQRKKNAWMISYAPADAPKYAIVALVEDSDAGGLSAAALVKTMATVLFQPDAVVNLQEATPIEETNDVDPYNYMTPMEEDVDEEEEEAVPSADEAYETDATEESEMMMEEAA